MLLASAMLATAFSAGAAVDAKKGDAILLKSGTDNLSALTGTNFGKLGLTNTPVDLNDWELKGLNGATWTVSAKKNTLGRDIYSFTHYMPISIVLAVILFAMVFKIHTKRESLDKSTLFVMSDAIDIVSFSIVGSMVALEYGYNIFGVLLIALANGVGGGIFRDMLYNEVPWFMKTGFYGTVCIVTGLIYYFMDLVGLNNMFFIMILFAFGVAFRMIAHKKNWRLPKIEKEK